MWNLYILQMLPLLILSTFLVPILAQTDPAGCLDRCGNISIPYPFGVGKGCFINRNFLVTCNQTSNKLFLGHYNGTIPRFEIRDISLFGELRVLQFVGLTCYKNKISRGWSNAGLNSGKFYVSSLKNKFVAYGCDTQAILRTGIQGQSQPGLATGCISLCNRIEDTTNGSCLGIGCCEASIPKKVQSIEIDIRSFNNHSFVETFNPCSYGFVAEQGTYNFSTQVLAESFFHEGLTHPMILEWSIGESTCDQAKMNATTYACKDNSNCHDFDNGNGYQCNCSIGYKGNPYLGCTDIDECQEVPRQCSMTCTNLPGTYKCSCPPGYEGDGRNDPGSTGCRSIPKKKIPWNNIALGVSISISCLLLGASWIYWALRKRKIIKLKEKFFEQNGGIMLRQQPFNPEGEGQSTNGRSSNIFGEEELKKATKNYHESHVLGQGGQGTVYKGVLTNNTIVAIKKSKQVENTQIEQFINEVIVLTQINHRNVVKLIGCCLETEVPMLVYEYVSNGTLYDHIQQAEHKWPILSWTNRLRIATEIAGALSYLHSAASIPIIHRDIKSTNILLDENYTAKVSDFGASRLNPMNQTQLTTLVQGTLGYLDPEYFHSSQLTEKSDVYSFGVLLVELMTSKKALDYERPEKEKNLANYFIKSFKEDRWHEIVDQKMIEETTEHSHLYEVVKLAIQCLKLQGDERPTMKEVAMELEGLRFMQNHPWRIHHHDQYNPEEVEGLLSHDEPNHNSCEIIDTNITTTISSASYDTIRNHVITPLEGGR